MLILPSSDSKRINKTTNDNEVNKAGSGVGVSRGELGDAQDLKRFLLGGGLSGTKARQN